jgi:hypothetical protein
LDTNHVWLRQAGAWRLEPGREIVYGQVTATKAVTAGSEAAADPLVVGTAAVFTAGVPVLIECFAPGVMPALVPSALVVFLLYADGSLLCRMGSVSNPAAGQLIVPVHMVYRFAPSGGSHQFTFAASQTGGTAQVLAGTGGSGTYPPIFLRITST